MSEQEEQEFDLDESWDLGASSSNTRSARAAASYRRAAKEALSIAKDSPEGSPSHSEAMIDHHTSMAKAIKADYHAGEYGSKEQARKDHKKHMDKAKEYRAALKEEFDLDEATSVAGDTLQASFKKLR
jgi:hypothetical protein